MALRKLLSGFAFWALAIALFVTPARAQLQVGNIAGTVQDATGAVIPGVTVTLMNPSIIGGNQTAVTDERGQYRFSRLVPAAYSVKAELTGFQKAQRENIVVNAEVTARVDLTLQVGNFADTVTVTGEAPLLDTTSALHQQVLDRELRNTIPTGGDLWSLSRLVPGAITGNYDIGGNQSFQQTGITVHGNPGSEKKFAIDGLDVTWAGGAGSTALYYDVGMFEEVNYQVGAISAENAQGGVVMNMVTRTGTNDFHGDFYFWGTNSRLQSDNLTPELKKDLLAAIPQRVKDVNPSLSPRTKILGLFDSNLSLSGPVIKNKLWWTASGKLNSLNQLVTGSYNADGTQAVDDNRIWNASGKLSYQMNSANALHFSYNRNQKNRYHRRSENFTEDRASHLQDQPGYVTQLKWTSTLNSRTVLDGSVGYSVIFFPTRQEPDVKQGDISMFDITTTTLRFAAATYSFRPADRGSVSFNASFFVRKHELKTGYQWNRSMEHALTWSSSDPTPLQARFRNEFRDAVEVREYSTPNESHSYLRENAWFIQDKWQPTKKLTVNMGLRLQKTIGYMPAECSAGNVFVPRQCFPVIRNVPDWIDLAPRLSLVYDLFGNGRTAIKASANHYNRSISITFPRAVSGNGTANRTVAWADRNNDKIPQISELDHNLAPAFDFGNTNRYAPGIKRPTSDEYSIEVQQQLPLDLVLSASYNRRDNWRGIESTNVSIPRSAFDPVDITIPDAFGIASKKVTIWNVQPAFFSRRDNLMENASARDTYYNGIDITATKRMSHHFMLLSGLSLGSNKNRKGGNYNDPNTNWFPGTVVAENVPVSFKVAGNFELPGGIGISGNLQHFTGKPERRTYQVTRAMVTQQTGKSLTPTSVTIDLAARGTDTLPDTNLLDISIRRTFKFAERYKLDPHLDIFNIINSNAIQSRVTDVSGSYHRVSEILSPRMFRIGFNMFF